MTEKGICFGVNPFFLFAKRVPGVMSQIRSIRGDTPSI